MLTAMVTPFASDGALDLEGAQRLAVHLVERGNDGLVVNGTTGESPTTSDAEKEQVLRAVIEAVGDRAYIVAGVGTNDTHHSAELARQAEKAGAHGLLVVTPYYNKPPQSGLLRHFSAVADTTNLPVMLYDDDLAASSWVLRRTDLAYYSGSDMLNLPLLSVGGTGFVSVVGHVVSDRLRELVDAYAAGDVVRARDLHLGLLPVYSGLFRTQGVILTKAALNLLGLPGGRVRPPLPDATEEEIALLRRDLADGGVNIPA